MLLIPLVINSTLTWSLQRHHKHQPTFPCLYLTQTHLYLVLAKYFPGFIQDVLTLQAETYWEDLLGVKHIFSSLSLVSGALGSCQVGKISILFLLFWDAGSPRVISLALTHLKGPSWIKKDINSYSLKFGLSSWISIISAHSSSVYIPLPRMLFNLWPPSRYKHSFPAGLF